MVNNMNTGTAGVTTTPAPVPPWERPKIAIMLSIFGGKVTQVKNIMEPTIRRANNETFYR